MPNRHTQEPPKDSPEHIRKRRCRRIVCIIATSISAILFIFGAEAMSMVDIIAPFLMALGALIVALAIMLSEDVWNFVSKKRIWVKLLIWVGICAVFTIPTYLYFYNTVTRQAQIL